MQPQPCAPIPIWIGGSSEAAIKRALRLDGWHGSRVGAGASGGDGAAAACGTAGCGVHDFPAHGLLRGTVGELRGQLAAYQEAGVQHVMVAPEDRDIESYLATTEQVWRCGEGL